MLLQKKQCRPLWKKYPHITVECEYGAWTGWEEKQVLKYSERRCADVLQIGSNWVHDYSKGGESFLDLYQYSDIIDLTQFPEDKLKRGRSKWKADGYSDFSDRPSVLLE